MLLLVVSACATGPSLKDSQASIQPLAPNMGRIYFYRDGSPFGAAIQPSVLVNQQRAGYSVPGGVFYRDYAPGSYVVSVETEVEKTVTVDLAAGQTRYVKMDMGFGWIAGRVHLTLVEAGQANADMQSLSLVQATN
jgi:Protein of unknown function (DUF2846)